MFYICVEFFKNIEDIGILSICFLEKNKVMILKNGRNYFKIYWLGG